MSTYAWGTRQFTFTQGPLGVGDATAQPATPTTIVLPDGVTIAKVCSTGPNTFFLATDGSMYACGANNYTFDGFLGNSSFDLFVHDVPELLAFMPSFVEISAGRDGTFGLTASGNLYAWGVNNNGGLGLGNNLPYSSPQLTRTNVAKVCAGAYYTLVLDIDGTVHAAGLNAYGQFGNGVYGGPDGGNSYYTWTPTATGLSVYDIQTAAQTVFLILNDGSVMAAGEGTAGHAGYNLVNAGGRVNTWTVVPGLSNIVEVVCIFVTHAVTTDYYASYFRDAAGSVYFYGLNTTAGNSGTGSIVGYQRGIDPGDVPDLVLMPVPCTRLAENTDSDLTFPSMAAVGTDHLLYTWGAGEYITGPTHGHMMGSGADAFANPTPVSINGLTGVGAAAIDYEGVFAIADLTFNALSGTSVAGFGTALTTAVARRVGRSYGLVIGA